MSLLGYVRFVDKLNETVGLSVRWLVLIAVIIGAGNATIRYIFDTSSNAWLEAQWYLFAAVFLTCSAYTLQRNEHVRIDVVSSKLSPRARAIIDILGTLLFLVPMSLMVIYMSIPVVEESFHRHEISSNAGGLLRWPVKALIPLGFALLLLQGTAELAKRVLFLQGRISDPGEKTASPH
jgi:TRAP-type mannitol/chloroaromatic compound transport system permease small subunit